MQGYLRKVSEGRKKCARVSARYSRRGVLPVGQAFQPAFTVDCDQATERVFFRPFHKPCRDRIVVDIIEFVYPVLLVSHQVIKILVLPQGPFLLRFLLFSR